MSPGHVSNVDETLPVAAVLPALKDALRRERAAVLQAPPGAGKTTLVPLTLLDEDWLATRTIVMLEPRRLAARAAAHRMAMLLGEAIAERVGYRVRLDSKVGPATRIEVVTEGVLTRMLQQDPALQHVGLVIFDEFHERSLQADLALALCLESRAALREDLRLLVMSATLEAAPVARLLGDAPVITSSGASYPVEIRYQPNVSRRLRASAVVARVDAARVAGIVAETLRRESGSMLVFLPGVAEIRQVEQALHAAALPPDVELAPLYGDLSQEAQDQAIRPSAPGRRKIVLATSIAETSLTIDGIRVVVDTGLMRVPRFEPNSGLTRLETIRVSQASAAQRCGRAGRLSPGVCYRLWSQEEDTSLQPHTTPEILEADLAPLALELAQWGVRDPDDLAWLDRPPPAHYAQACDLLTRLDALDSDGRITPHGRELASMAMHPRLAHMVRRGEALGHARLACELAALLSERDILRRGTQADERSADLQLRVSLLRKGATSHDSRRRVDEGAVYRVRKAALQAQQQLRHTTPEGGNNIEAVGLLLAFAYPDRIAQRRPGPEPRYRLANGRGAVFRAHEPLSHAEFVVAAQLDAGAREARIFLAAAITRDTLLQHFAEQLRTETVVAWDAREQAVLMRARRRLGELILDDQPLAGAEAGQILDALLQGIRAMGLGCLPWNPSLRSWQDRVQFLRRIDPEQWPDVSDEALLDSLERWLAPYLVGKTRRSHLQDVDLRSALSGLLSWQQQRALDELAPTHIAVPSGSRIPIDYGGGATPVLAVRLQEMFGTRETPRIGGGRVALLLHLLSPARRPVQVTQDLAGFWNNSYRDVKKDLKGRYPKHYWPEDPLQATPTSRTKPRG